MDDAQMRVSLVLIRILWSSTEFMFQFTGFKKQQATIVSAYNYSLIRDPCLTQEILRLHFLEGKLFQVTLTVAEQFEYAIANNTQLSIVLRVEGHL